MQFPESWLREFCDPPLNTQQLADVLTMAGLEVESLQPVAPPFSGVVVAEILSVEPHPQADRLRVCRVDAGAPDGALQIVCGAPNARAGIRVPLARVGAELPAAPGESPLRIGVGRLRGVDSHGMLCSARELRLADDHAGLLELPADALVGQDLRQCLQLDDWLFTLKLTPNLAHALSVYGIAREVSALTGAALRTPAIAAVPAQHHQRLPVEVRDLDLCGRFSGRIVRGVDTQARTPAWMVQRLARCGQRSVSALVDISNYVMFEYGRPTHIFDLDKIHERLIVRWARAGEALTLLNGNTVALDTDVGVIADAQGVESLAGIMGGQDTAVSDDTRNVYVEAAFWWPQAVQGRSRRFNFSTDAGHRFERGVDPAQTAAHIERITALILSICGGEAGPLDDHVLRLPARHPVTLRVARASRVIGMPVAQDTCAGVLQRLGFDCEQADGLVTATPPPWRFDIQIEEDLIEEVIRVVGYDHLPTTAPRAPLTPRVQPESRRSTHQVRHRLAALDYQETIGFSFVEARWEQDLAGNADPIRVLNPIAAPLAVMRSSLLGSLIAALRHNLARRMTRVRLFEVGRIFRRDASVTDGPLTVAGVDQPLRVAGLAYGPVEPLQWGMPERAVDFFDLKGDVQALLGPLHAEFVAATHPALHPGRCAAIRLQDRVVGHLGELHPRWRHAYELPQSALLFELDLAAVLQRPMPAYQTLPRQQAVWRDLALVVDEAVSHDRLMDCLRDDPAGLVRAATLFDVYKPAAPAPGWAAGEHSLAVRLELQPQDSPLTEEHIEAVVAAAVARASARVGGRLRS